MRGFFFAEHQSRIIIITVRQLDRDHRLYLPRRHQTISMTNRLNFKVLNKQEITFGHRNSTSILDRIFIRANGTNRSVEKIFNNIGWIRFRAKSIVLIYASRRFSLIFMPVFYSTINGKRNQKKCNLFQHQRKKKL